MSYLDHIHFAPLPPENQKRPLISLPLSNPERRRDQQAPRVLDGLSLHIVYGFYAGQQDLLYISGSKKGGWFLWF